MDIPSSTTGLATLATSMAQSKTESATSVAVLKKAMDIQEQSATQLIESLPTPDGTGTRVNVTA